jgi:hypothetical protein
MSEIHQVLMGTLPFAQNLGDDSEHFNNADVGAVTLGAFWPSWRGVLILRSSGGPARGRYGASFLEIVACSIHVCLLIDR